jgi:hypothetical protein
MRAPAPLHATSEEQMSGRLCLAKLQVCCCHVAFHYSHAPQQLLHRQCYIGISLPRQHSVTI